MERDVMQLDGGETNYSAEISGENAEKQAQPWLLNNELLKAKKPPPQILTYPPQRRKLQLKTYNKP